MPDGEDHPETWIFHLAMAWLADPNHSLSYAERLALIKERAKEMAEPARSAFTWIPDDTPVHKADISYWITQPWDNRGGRMTLVGDAAHPMPPCKLTPLMPNNKHFIDSLTDIDLQIADRVSIIASAISLIYLQGSSRSATVASPCSKSSPHTRRR